MNLKAYPSSPFHVLPMAPLNLRWVCKLTCPLRSLHGWYNTKPGEMTCRDSNDRSLPGCLSGRADLRSWRTKSLQLGLRHREAYHLHPRIHALLDSIVLKPDTQTHSCLSLLFNFRESKNHFTRYDPGLAVETRKVAALLRTPLSNCRPASLWGGLAWFAGPSTPSSACLGHQESVDSGIEHNRAAEISSPILETRWQ